MFTCVCFDVYEVNTIVKFVFFIYLFEVLGWNSGGHAFLADAFNLLRHFTGPRNSLGT